MPRSAREGEEYDRLSVVSDEDHAEVADQLRRVIAWEIEAQIGVRRPIEKMPPLIADTLLDFFDITLKPGAQPPAE